MCLRSIAEDLVLSKKDHFPPTARRIGVPSASAIVSSTARGNGFAVCPCHPVSHCPPASRYLNAQERSPLSKVNSFGVFAGLLMSGQIKRLRVSPAHR